MFKDSILLAIIQIINDVNNVPSNVQFTFTGLITNKFVYSFYIMRYDRLNHTFVINISTSTFSQIFVFQLYL